MSVLQEIHKTINREGFCTVNAGILGYKIRPEKAGDAAYRLRNRWRDAGLIVTGTSYQDNTITFASTNHLN